MIYLTLPELLHIAERTLGAGYEVRDYGLLESALARPRATAFGQDAYPDLDAKAAALLHSVARDHALIDGNKRLALAAVIAFYGLNGYRLTLTNDEAYDLVIIVAAGQLNHVDAIAAVLQPAIKPRLPPHPEEQVRRGRGHHRPGALGHFLPAERPALFDGVHRALRPGGLFALPAGAPLPVTSVRHWALLGFDLVMRVRNAVRRPPFVMYYRTGAVAALRADLTAAGFAVADISVTDLGPDGGQGRLVLARKAVTP